MLELQLVLTHKYLFQAWTLGDTLCKIFPVIFYGNVAVSLLSMVGITLNRWVVPANCILIAVVFSHMPIINLKLIAIP